MPSLLKSSVHGGEGEKGGGPWDIVTGAHPPTHKHTYTHTHTYDMAIIESIKLKESLKTYTNYTSTWKDDDEDDGEDGDDGGQRDLIQREGEIDESTKVESSSSLD